VGEIRDWVHCPRGFEEEKEAESFSHGVAQSKKGGRTPTYKSTLKKRKFSTKLCASGTESQARGKSLIPKVGTGTILTIVKWMVRGITPKKIMTGVQYKREEGRAYSFTC